MKWKQYWKTLYFKKLNDVRLVYQYQVDELQTQIQSAGIENGTDLERMGLMFKRMKESNETLKEWVHGKGMEMQLFYMMGVFGMEGLYLIQSKEQIRTKLAESDMEIDDLDRVWTIIQTVNGQSNEQ